MDAVQSKWGTVQKNFDAFGEYPVGKIILCQSVVTFIFIVLIKPQIVTSTQSSSHISKINYLKVIIITIILVIATYYIPPFLRR
tara:strand:- start:2134 stop:2385 length:252 start_codon:yes stop_codon:yes gene_type:complete